jgi:hypothetical protein
MLLCNAEECVRELSYAAEIQYMLRIEMVFVRSQTALLERRVISPYFFV